ncbi:glycerate kinase type-2 family protein [Rhizobium paknamense]|uniref:Hydroxypyruvate reductase n=1 Tax=Rhizobium paknamense TaxID=1206817 RepID=A0ABU0IC54_9HYPH|nr:glycerate kinase [Rhizobium paknamense]MDQ0455819.1 hydroxypyruvate reductase [Rhizobium paknamense]
MASSLENKRISPENAEAAHLLRQVFDQALKAVDPLLAVPPFLPPEPAGRTVVVGAGKAAARMAEAVERHWQGPLSGTVVTRYGHGADCRKIKVIEAGHPVPDSAGALAAEEILSAVQGLGKDDLVLCLMSGGGSALLTRPAAGISLEEKRAINRALLNSGAPIQEMNCVRRHLSAIKGGGLLAACGAARVVTLVISDVPGDDPAVVASGPTVPDDTTPADALAILKRYRIEPPASVLAHLTANTESRRPKPAPGTVHVIATAQQALEAAADAARTLGITPLILSDRMEGEAREVGKVHAAIALQIRNHAQPVAAPALILSGGETTVTVHNSAGRGGRNQEFLLSLAIALDGADGIHALACDTDGIDGSEEVAGAMLHPETLAMARMAGLDPKQQLAMNDAYTLFAATDTLIETGPTRTNVNDLRALLVL